MSSGVWEGVAATLIATGVVTGIGYVVVGPKAAGLFLAVGVIIAIVLGLIRRKKTSSPSAPPINNSSTLTASPHIEQHVHFGYEERKPSEPQAKEPELQKDETPNITALKPKEVLLHEGGRGVWHEASTDLARSWKAIVVPFKNMPKPPGEHTPRASSVSASLVFRNFDNSDDRHINHGVWLDHYEYFATLNSGETEQLLVALKDAPFVTFENPNAYNPFGGFVRSGTAFHHPQKIALWTEGTVEIVLVDGRNVTLFNGTFDYKFSTEEMVLTPKRPAAGKVHFVPDTYNFGWGGNDGRTDLRAGGIFTYDGVGSLTVASAFLKGTTLKSNMVAQVITADGRPSVLVNSFVLRAHEPLRLLLNLWLTPVKAERGQPLRGQLVLRDNYNLDYEIDAVDWPWIGGQIPKPSG